MGEDLFCGYTCNFSYSEGRGRRTELTTATRKLVPLLLLLFFVCIVLLSHKNPELNEHYKFQCCYWITHKRHLSLHSQTVKEELKPVTTVSKQLRLSFKLPWMIHEMANTTVWVWFLVQTQTNKPRMIHLSQSRIRIRFLKTERTWLWSSAPQNINRRGWDGRDTQADRRQRCQWGKSATSRALLHQTLQLRAVQPSWQTVRHSVWFSVGYVTCQNHSVLPLWHKSTHRHR